MFTPACSAFVSLTEVDRISLNSDLRRFSEKRPLREVGLGPFRILQQSGYCFVVVPAPCPIHTLTISRYSSTRAHRAGDLPGGSLDGRRRAGGRTTRNPQRGDGDGRFGASPGV